ncbi:MAG TPA: HNH endonuclease signature motif containing protein [Brevundimonas sp.]|jgi:hypothetical protein|uniref:HNH endonuclease n=1 Tax=Brevundimonas sp. TaxID=1871086 RepID=UPI002DEA0614|nr:HNH endonuclease signature motif containing protein [Brevundimonas sp.]
MISRLALAEAQNWRCAYCAVTLDVDPMRPSGATREHVVPRAREGMDRADNLVAACRACNETRACAPNAAAFHDLRQALLRRNVWPAGTWPDRTARAKLHQEDMALSVQQWKERRRAHAERRDGPLAEVPLVAATLKEVEAQDAFAPSVPIGHPPSTSRARRRQRQMAEAAARKAAAAQKRRLDLYRAQAMGWTKFISVTRGPRWKRLTQERRRGG